MSSGPRPAHEITSVYTNPHGCDFSNLGKVRECCPHLCFAVLEFTHADTHSTFAEYHSVQPFERQWSEGLCPHTSAKPTEQPSSWTSMVLVRPSGCMDVFFHLWELIFLPLQLTLLPELYKEVYLRCDVVLRILL